MQSGIGTVMDKGALSRLCWETIIGIIWLCGWKFLIQLHNIPWNEHTSPPHIWVWSFSHWMSKETEDPGWKSSREEDRNIRYHFCSHFPWARIHMTIPNGNVTGKYSPCAQEIRQTRMLVRNRQLLPQAVSLILRLIVHRTAVPFVSLSLREMLDWIG